jgi:alkaline phosphatase D
MFIKRKGMDVTSFDDLYPALAAVRATAGVFRHGVASGDPDSSSVVLWTRASLAAPGPVAWEVATTPDFDRVVQRGEVEAGPEKDYTVKVVTKGLSPAGIWYYRFLAEGESSPVGRARTLPDGPIDTLGVALVSCSNYAFGHFNAYDAIASDSDVDFVLHTGDYLYEYGANEWGGDIARRLGRVHEPPHEIVSLADYRRRHAQYKSDPDAQAMHAAHTLLACWDADRLDLGRAGITPVPERLCTDAARELLAWAHERACACMHACMCTMAC